MTYDEVRNQCRIACKTGRGIMEVSQDMIELFRLYWADIDRIATVSRKNNYYRIAFNTKYYWGPDDSAIPGRTLHVVVVDLYDRSARAR